MTNKSPNTKGILWLQLSPQSQAQLKQAFPPRYPNSFYHHVTLAFGVTRQEVEQYIGQPAVVQAYAYASNVQVEAVRVATDGLPDTYGVPHVTLSTATGIEPFESVAMLQAQHHEVSIEPPLELQGIMAFIPLK